MSQTVAISRRAAAQAQAGHVHRAAPATATPWTLADLPYCRCRGCSRRCGGCPGTAGTPSTSSGRSRSARSRSSATDALLKFAAPSTTVTHVLDHRPRQRNASGGYIRLYNAEDSGYTNGVWRAEGDTMAHIETYTPLSHETEGPSGAPAVARVGRSGRPASQPGRCARSATCRCGCTPRTGTCRSPTRSSPGRRGRRAVPGPRRRAPPSVARACTAAPSSTPSSAGAQLFGLTEFADDETAAALFALVEDAAATPSALFGPVGAAAQPDRRRHHLRLRRARLHRLGLEPGPLPRHVRAARLHPPLRGRHVALSTLDGDPERCSRSTTPGSPPSGWCCGTAPGAVRRAAADPAGDAQRVASCSWGTTPRSPPTSSPRRPTAWRICSTRRCCCGWRRTAARSRSSSPCRTSRSSS